jgi:hypothetical protein
MWCIISIVTKGAVEQLLSQLREGTTTATGQLLETLESFGRDLKINTPGIARRIRE